MWLEAKYYKYNEHLGISYFWIIFNFSKLLEKTLVRVSKRNGRLSTTLILSILRMEALERELQGTTEAWKWDPFDTRENALLLNTDLSPLSKPPEGAGVYQKLTVFYNN